MCCQHHSLTDVQCCYDGFNGCCCFCLWLVSLWNLFIMGRVMHWVQMGSRCAAVSTGAPPKEWPPSHSGNTDTLTTVVTQIH